MPMAFKVNVLQQQPSDLRWQCGIAQRTHLQLKQIYPVLPFTAINLLRFCLQQAANSATSQKAVRSPDNVT